MPGAKMQKCTTPKKNPDLVLINSVLWDYLFYYLSLVSQHACKWLIGLNFLFFFLAVTKY